MQARGVGHYPCFDPVLQLARPIIEGCAGGIAGLSLCNIVRPCWVEAGKLGEEDWELGSAVEEDDEHGCGEADSEGQLMLVHGCWSEPVKDTLPCTAQVQCL